jgi:hypothetical protein
MAKLNPEKLIVEYEDDVTATDPIIPRRYTLTHSDITAELFLTIGRNYSYDKINESRDEVLGEWVYEREKYIYYAYLYVDGETGGTKAEIRNYIFRRELPLALEAIRYGDRKLFNKYKELDSSPIFIFFLSTNPLYSKVENWGTFSVYTI